MTAPTQSRTPGWVVYSGIMLTLLGIKIFVDGLWALDRSDTVIDELFYETDLGTWGWIWTICGIIVFLAGISVFSRAQWARWVGIAAASFAVIVNLSWIYVYPVSSLIGILLASLVMYGLAVYGEDDSPA